MKGNKIAFILFALMLFLITIYSASAAVTTTPPNTAGTQVNLAEIEIKKLIVQEEAKTRNDFIVALNERDIRILAQTQTMVDENFVVLDNRLDNYLRKATFKLGVAFMAGLVFGGSFLILLQLLIKKKTYFQPSFKDDKFVEKVKFLEEKIASLERINFEADGKITRERSIEQKVVPPVAVGTRTNTEELGEPKQKVVLDEVPMEKLEPPIPPKPLPKEKKGFFGMRRKPKKIEWTEEQLRGGI